MFVTEPGDATADHRAAVLATQQQARDTAAQIMTRLRGQYASRAAFDGQALTLQQLQRLYRCVAGEFV